MTLVAGVYPGAATGALTIAGRCVFGEQLLFADMSWQVRRGGEQDELDPACSEVDSEVLFNFSPPSVKPAGRVPAALLPAWAAAASLPPSSAFIRGSAAALGAEGGIGLLALFSPILAGGNSCSLHPLTGEVKL